MVDASALGELRPVPHGTAVALTKITLLIGRTKDCDIVLPHSDVSRHHCRLLVKHSYWHIEDLDSKNGTKVNHVPVKEKRVMPGDRLEIAGHAFELRYHADALGAIGLPKDDLGAFKLPSLDGEDSPTCELPKR